MTKRGKVYIAIITLAILALVVFEMTKPKDINWFPSYTTHHKIPFGSLVFYEQLNRVSDTVIKVERPPYEYLKDNAIKGTYLFYNGGINFGEAELERLLEWTSKGNTLVVSAVDFEQKLLDTLNLDTESVNTFNNFNNTYQLKLVNPSLEDAFYNYNRATTLFHFNKIDTLNTKVVGHVDKQRVATDSITNPLINVIKQPFGDGEIILSTFPQTFTNYFILEDLNYKYTAGIMSYLDTDNPIYLDAHYKSGKKFYTSPMYLFLNNEHLKWGYYIILIGVLVYIIFEGKRKQRAIPIIPPLKNQTLDFTRTIADMYYESEKHKEIAQHKIQHFLEYIRNHMYLNTSEINTDFIKNSAARSNNTLEDTTTLFNYIEKLQHTTKINNLQLEKLNSLIETFKSHNQWKTKK